MLNLGRSGGDNVNHTHWKSENSVWETTLVGKLVCVFDLHPDIHFDIALNKNYSVIYSNKVLTATASMFSSSKSYIPKLHELPELLVRLNILRVNENV